MPRRHSSPKPGTEPGRMPGLEARLRDEWLIQTGVYASWRELKAARNAGTRPQRERPQATERDPRTERVGMRDARAALAKYLAA